MRKTSISFSTWKVCNVNNEIQRKKRRSPILQRREMAVERTNTLGESSHNPASSCIRLSKLKGYTPGVYWIQPSPKYPPFKTYCREGGWTMIMKIDGREQTFDYFSSLWTSTSSFNENSIEFDHTEAKLPSFWTLPTKEILLGIKTGHEMRWITIQKQSSSLRALFSGNQPTNLGRTVWKSLIRGSSLQPNCDREGFNVNMKYVYVRIGISSNQENDCNSNDSWLGFGGRGLGACNTSFTRWNLCGNIATCAPDNGNQNIFSMGYIFAR
eukprot:m.57274 g.57274  ORF g.57274 m.57274 type:complete len:269 (+) comp34701_c0_seq3:363-1169(+)